MQFSDIKSFAALGEVVNTPLGGISRIKELILNAEVCVQNQQRADCPLGSVDDICRALRAGTYQTDNV